MATTKSTTRRIPSSSFRGGRTIGTLIDEHYALELRKDALEAEIRDIKKQLDALAGEAMERMETEGLDSGKGSTALGRVEERTHYNIGDYKKFTDWIWKNRRFELFQNRISSKAYVELIGLGLKPAGVTTFTEKVFRTTKRK